MNEHATTNKAVDTSFTKMCFVSSLKRSSSSSMMQVTYFLV